jgi:hypothetical protein
MAEKKDYVTRKVKTESGEVVEVKLKPVAPKQKPEPPKPAK